MKRGFKDYRLVFSRLLLRLAKSPSQPGKVRQERERKIESLQSEVAAPKTAGTKGARTNALCPAANMAKDAAKPAPKKIQIRRRFSNIARLTASSLWRSQILRSSLWLFGAGPSPRQALSLRLISRTGLIKAEHRPSEAKAGLTASAAASVPFLGLPTLRATRGLTEAFGKAKLLST